LGEEPLVLLLVSVGVISFVHERKSGGVVEMQGFVNLFL
jgi:hypothetical protein